ncbi:dipicolinate synthase subunit DpsA [Selenihalanaerobacter shriftii]|uniref:Dipicolinate synthase subunit A n=1 Tax=Selenihalanaerobacter shriftii TaxID=142842 RepID=A0A1T4JNE2_9FIRM|nr:dipicolinate synthase subunit DpsA [Selenihalanaerobacter shriftii]SJZ31661.1 dipicolinate synthase subunit A [Selenihalanaerobacter shriftii]
MKTGLKGTKIAVLGGDRREQRMLKLLVATGAHIKTLGMPADEDLDIIVKDELSEVTNNVDVVIAPMVSADETGYLKATFIDKEIKLTEEFFANLEFGTLFFIGIARGKLVDYCEKHNIKLVEMAKLDEIAILNAIPTAEGAIQVAMEESNITLHSNKSMVLGLGRVGLTQARMLAGLGSKTYGVARNPADRARAKEMGIIPVDFSELKVTITDMDFIFNTVPKMVLTRDILTRVKQEAIIIDLASSPGGTDFDAAEELGIKSILSLGLPGKVAPKTAGQILGDVIPRLIIEEL